MNYKLMQALERLTVHDHLCLIYETQEEQFAAVVPFIRIGLERSEKCIYIADDNTAASVLFAMRSEGIEVESAINRGALAITSKRETYLRSGFFDPDAMIWFLKEAIDKAKTEGFSALRVTGEMTWALGDDPGAKRLMEYESKLNYFFPENDVVAICQYNSTRFRPEVLIDVIYTHPLIIFSNLVCRNFYYFPPDEFLKPDRTSMELKRLLKNLIDREQAEEVLRESETELKESQRVAKVGSWHWIVVSDTISWSEGYYHIIGRDPALPPPNYRDHLKMYIDESAARLERAVAESLKNGTPYELDLELLHPDGSPRFMIARGEAVRDGGGQVVMLRGTLQDITERKRAEEEIRKLNSELEKRVRARTNELEATNKELEAFSYSVSHDLRAPLRGIEGFSQALLEDYGDKLDEQGKDYLARVRAATQKMSQLIEAMLSLSRLTRGEIKPEVVNLSTLAKTIADELKRMEPDRKVEFVIGKEITANGDMQMLRIVLENLLSNAWKFTCRHPTARIEFGVQKVEGKTAYLVRDDGAGFDMAYAGKLFTAFQRLHTDAEFPGIGIGLATVQRIIHRHGGKVWAEGEVEKGATFYFTL